MNNPQFAKEKEILGGNNPGDEVAEVEPAELARAHVHAILAVASAVGVLADIMEDTRSRTR